MTGKADKRRPLFVAVALVTAIGAALVAPVMIGARRGEPIPGSTVRADSRERITISAAQPLFSSPNVVIERGVVSVVGPDSGETLIGAAVRALITGGGADLVSRADKNRRDDIRLRGLDRAGDRRFVARMRDNRRDRRNRARGGDQALVHLVAPRRPLARGVACRGRDFRRRQGFGLGAHHDKNSPTSPGLPPGKLTIRARAL